MSVGNNHEMENIEENQVTKGAATGDPIQKGPGWEDLGGPTPENSRPDDDSNKLKTPGATLAQVKDVVNAKAAKAEAVSDEVEDGQEVVSEDEVATDEVVAEEETTEEEVVSEEEASTDEVVAEEEDVVAGGTGGASGCELAIGEGEIFRSAG